MSNTQKLTVTVSDLDKLANLISAIDDSKTNPITQQIFINMAHEKIDSMLGEFSAVVYDAEEIAA